MLGCCLEAGTVAGGSDWDVLVRQELAQSLGARA
jgi:hypothetical protein